MNPATEVEITVTQMKILITGMNVAEVVVDAVIMIMTKTAHVILGNMRIINGIAITRIHIRREVHVRVVKVDLIDEDIDPKVGHQIQIGIVQGLEAILVGGEKQNVAGVIVHLQVIMIKQKIEKRNATKPDGVRKKRSGETHFYQNRTQFTRISLVECLSF